MARKRSSRGITAWLVTWEHSGDHAKPERRVAAVFSSRLGGDRVRELVEVLYANANSTVGELIGYARNTRSNPYQATFGSVNGVRWTGQITCGHNPRLLARLVDNLRIDSEDADENEAFWDERPRPVLPDIDTPQDMSYLLARNDGGDDKSPPA